MEKGTTELIFIPVPGYGHLVSTVEIAKRLIRRDDRISVTILSMKSPGPSSIDAYTKTLTESDPQIRLIDLPPVNPPPLDLLTKSPETFIYSFIELQIPHVRKTVTDIVSGSGSGPRRVFGLVIDLFCVSMIDVANELDLPSYMFLTSNAGFLSLMMYLPSRHEENSVEFESSDPDSLIPGFPDPVPTKVLPSALFSKIGGYESYIKFAKRFKDTKGILINTVEELEAYGVDYFVNGHIRGQNPPIYPVGPVLDLNGPPNPELNPDEKEKIMRWLDDQPQSSVIFLCFGSLGSFEPAQVREIALGLEQSGYRFLWCVRLSQQKDKDSSAVDDGMPEGFLERMGERGMVCGWAPQVEVLAHKAIGGFMSHCGWNSIMESVWYGVPIVTWPMYAEQQLNAFLMVKELGLAVEMRLDYRQFGDLVVAEEIEKALHCVMDGGSQVREKVKEMSEKARKAVEEGGSSFRSVGRFIEDVIGKK